MHGGECRQVVASRQGVVLPCAGGVHAACVEEGGKVFGVDALRDRHRQLMQAKRRNGDFLDPRQQFAAARPQGMREGRVFPQQHFRIEVVPTLPQCVGIVLRRGKESVQRWCAQRRLQGALTHIVQPRTQQRRHQAIDARQAERDACQAGRILFGERNGTCQIRNDWSIQARVARRTVLGEKPPHHAR